MTGENKYESYWKEWREILLIEFESRLTAPGTKGYRIVPAKKTFIAIFLQVKGFPITADDILPEAIRIIKEKNIQQSGISSPAKEYDAVAMMGHHIGMLENSAGLRQYLQDIQRLLKPEGQILLTSLDVPAVNEKETKSSTTVSYALFQQANLTGPFFGLLRIKADTLKSQAAAADWECELLYLQDENNYLARLRPVDSG